MDKNIKAIEKMLFHIGRLERTLDGIEFEQYLDSEILQDASILNILQIGENVSLLDEDFIKAHSEIPWRKIKAVRNVFVHNYDGIDMNSMWALIKRDIPELKEKLINITAENK